MMAWKIYTVRIGEINEPTELTGMTRELKTKQNAVVNKYLVIIVKEAHHLKDLKAQIFPLNGILLLYCSLPHMYSGIHDLIAYTL